ncbi:MAG: hypothetical protein E6R02_04935 [Gammaproteobacteria bacterium]|nr:MAG: hypothetical protein E6R02_04935 [Gammaproteobacteria bacterium]
MGNSKQYTDEFRAEAVKHVVEGAGCQEDGAGSRCCSGVDRLSGDSPAQGRTEAGNAKQQKTP